MKIKKKYKNSYWYLSYLYLNTFIYRFIRCRLFKPFYLKAGVHLTDVAKKNNSFYGYYNISPENNQREFLYLNSASCKVRASIHTPVKIYLKDSSENHHVISLSKSWNWQQGNMLHWINSNDGKIIFNDFVDNKYVAKIYDKSAKCLKTYNNPVYTINKMGTFALTLSFERLAKYRPDYGYFNKPFHALLNDTEDGVWYIDLISAEAKLIITLDSLKKLNPSGTMDGAAHKVNHIMLNDTGNRFMFLHRWIGPQGRFMRLITANTDGSDLCILNGDEMTSHCCWADDNHILAFCKIPEGGIGYYYFTDRTSISKLFSAKLPLKDGHPSFSPDKKWLITDTYPNKARYSSLCLYNIEKEQLYNIGQFYQPLEFRREKRVDLHPKWLPDGKRVAFESGHSGSRRLYIADCSSIINAMP